MRIVGIVQARMGSTRLPRKTLIDIEGKPLLQHFVERAQRCRLLHELVVATTQNREDDEIVEFCEKLGVRTFRGSQDDVLDRFYQCAKAVAADVCMRLTADDPFKDPEVMEKVAKYWMDHQDLEYVSNTIVPTYPEGLDIEIFTTAALERAWSEARLPSEREHVTPYLWKHGDRFRLANVAHDRDLSALRWTIDVPQDVEFARAVYARLRHRGVFLLGDILNLLEAEPELGGLNHGIPRNQGYLASLQQDPSEAIKEGDA